MAEPQVVVITGASAGVGRAAARAFARRRVRLAAGKRRRELFVGGSTIVTVAGQRLAPALGDWHLARTGHDSQQTGEPERDRPGNLFDPLPRDLGARGRFGAEAIDRSIQLWATRHRILLAILGGAAFMAVRRR